MAETEKRPAPRLSMPDLVGQPLARALRVLQHYGLQPALQLVEREGKLGSIFAQLPAAGTPMRPGDPVRLAVIQESPIQYLPEIFQDEDRRDRDTFGNSRHPYLLRRFLMLIQHQMAGLELTIETLHEALDPARAPRPLLPWLARFFPIELDASWSADRVRQVMVLAPRLLAIRGTAEGLEEMVALYFGFRPKVYENAWPHRGVVVGQSRVGTLVCVSTVPPAAVACYVEVPAEVELDRVAWERLLRLVDREKPAHLRACVVRAPAAGAGDAARRGSVVGRMVVG